jgi:peptidylprolyl isomerase
VLQPHEVIGADSVAGMRRLAALAASIVLLTVACGDSKSSGGTTTPVTTGPGTTAPGSAVSTTVNPNKPKVSLPDPIPTELKVTDLKVGTGPKAVDGDTIIVNYVGVRSADGTEFDNSYDHQPFEVPIGAGQVIKGWDQGLVGIQKGGRRQLDIPASLAYGDAPPDTAVIKPGDALSFIIDVIEMFPGSKASEEPKVKIVAAGNSTTPKNTDLVVGTGAEPADGEHVAIRIVLYRADDASKLTSTWGGPPLVFELGPKSTTYPGFAAAVKGMKVGGRRQSQIPFSTVFDGKGNDTLKLPASTDLIAVIDLIGTY